MAEKLEEMTARLVQLTEVREILDAAIEDMIASMAQVPAEERAGGPWARDGASTRKYLELTGRQAEVEAEIIKLGRAIASSDDASTSSLH